MTGDAVAHLDRVFAGGGQERAVRGEGEPADRAGGGDQDVGGLSVARHGSTLGGPGKNAVRVPARPAVRAVTLDGMSRVVLVGVDGSTASMRAAVYAAGLARRERCLLV